MLKERMHGSQIAGPGDGLLEDHVRQVGRFVMAAVRDYAISAAQLVWWQNIATDIRHQTM